MKKLLSLFLSSVLFFSCQVDELSPALESSSDADLYGSIESLSSTKTTMDENNNVLWSEGDQLVAFMGSTLSSKYQIKEQYIGTNTGGFSKVETESSDDLESGQELDHNVVLYPYSESVWCMKNDSNSPTGSYKLNVVLPETQTYSEGSFGIGSFPMLAVSSTNRLTFKNVCGGLKLQFKGVDKIKSIKVEGLGGEKLSGKSTVIGYVEGNSPSLTMSSTGGTSVTLDCGEGVQLSESTPTTFIISLPPVTFSSGLRLTVTDTDGCSRTLTNGSSNTILRSTLLTFPVITYSQEGVFELQEGAMTSYDVPSEGGSIEIPVVTNLEYSVVIPDDAQEWISLADTKALREETIVLSVASNTSSAFRSAEVLISDNDGSVLQTITVNQESSDCYIDESQFNPDLYLRYVSNYYSEGGGDAFDYNIYKYSSYIYNSAFASAAKVEYKFQLQNLPGSNCYLSVVERDDSTRQIYFNQNGLNFNSTSFTWEELGIEPTDLIVLSFEGTTRTLNGKTFALSSLYRGGYIYSGYYYDRDDGVYSVYYPFQDNAKLYYAKGWDSEGKLIYLGGPAISVGPSGTDEACWKSVYYYNSELSTQYHYAYYTSNQEYTPYGFGNLLGPEIIEVSATDLSASGTANSYIVSESGSYKFTPTKGNSSESVGTISSVEVLWESFGTDVTPSVGDLVRNVSYSDGSIFFETPSTFTEGNAVIAAKDASGTILWSWHIWLTDEPESQVYYNNAGTMMDRNLGATSATPGDVGALGLLYQWGRKDPFLGSSSISSSTVAASTLSWPSVVGSTSSTGTIDYVTANPTTFITYNSNNYDWYYTVSSSTDDSRWQSEKTIYDPCPSGWRVPDGGSNGIWSTAFGSGSSFDYTYDSTNAGMNFSGKFGSASTIWYPASGYRRGGDGGLNDVGNYGDYWSVTPRSSRVYHLFFHYDGSVIPSNYNNRASGYAVRCLQE